MPKATTKRRAETADNVFHQGALAAKMLREIAEATDAPYLKPVAGISLLILDAVQVGVVSFQLLYTSHEQHADGQRK